MHLLPPDRPRPTPSDTDGVGDAAPSRAVARDLRWFLTWVLVYGLLGGAFFLVVGRLFPSPGGRRQPVSFSSRLVGQWVAVDESGVATALASNTLLLRADGTYLQVVTPVSGAPKRYEGTWNLETLPSGRTYVRFSNLWDAPTGTVSAGCSGVDIPLWGAMRIPIEVDSPHYFLKQPPSP